MSNMYLPNTKARFHGWTQLRGVDGYHGTGKIRTMSIFVFTSDHGESLGEHQLWFCHGGLFEPTVLSIDIAVPQRPQTTNGVCRPVDIVDIMPTILSLYTAHQLHRVMI